MGHTTKRKGQEQSRPSDGMRRVGRPTIAVLGGTGMTGTHLVRVACRKGHAVRVLARDPLKVPANQKTAIVVGDATDPNSIDQLVDGADVVISCVGPALQYGGARVDTVSSIATENIIRVLARKPLTRYIVVSRIGVELKTDQRSLWARVFTKYVAARFHGELLRDRLAEAQLLQSSGLDWTLVRCPKIENAEAKSQVVVSQNAVRGRFVRAGELAEFLVEQVGSEQFVRRGLYVSSTK